jgi:hypothetical protein
MVPLAANSAACSIWPIQAILSYYISTHDSNIKIFGMSIRYLSGENAAIVAILDGLVGLDVFEVKKRAKIAK